MLNNHNGQFGFGLRGGLFWIRIHLSDDKFEGEMSNLSPNAHVSSSTEDCLFVLEQTLTSYIPVDAKGLWAYLAFTPRNNIPEATAHCTTRLSFNLEIVTGSRFPSFPESPEKLPTVPSVSVALKWWVLEWSPWLCKDANCVHRGDELSVSHVSVTIFQVNEVAIGIH